MFVQFSTSVSEILYYYASKDILVIAQWYSIQGEAGFGVPSARKSFRIAFLLFTFED